MPSNPREEIRKIIEESIKNELQIPQSKTRQANEVIRSRSEELLENFEKSLLIAEIKDIIVNDCKDALIRSSKFDRFLEIALFLLSIIAGILVTILAFASDTSFDLNQIIWISRGALILCLAQVILYLILKFRS